MQIFAAASAGKDFCRIRMHRNSRNALHNHDQCHKDNEYPTFHHLSSNVF